MFLHLSVSHSIHRGKGVLQNPPGQTPLDRHPQTDTPGQTQPLGRHNPWADTTPGQTQPLGRNPPGRNPPGRHPLGRHPQADTPPADTPSQTPMPSVYWDTCPPAQCMLGYTSPLPSACWDTQHSPGSHCSWRYASYWNAFLFILRQLIPKERTPLRRIQNLPVHAI